MTLQDAVYQVLKARRRPMNIQEIAHEIELRELYEEQDGILALSKQVAGQIETCPELFVKFGQRVSLRSWQRAA